MNSEFFKALDELESEKNIKKEFMLEKIGQALIAAYKKDNLFAAENDNIFVDVDQNKMNIRLYVRKTVVEEVENDETEISLDEAHEISPKYNIGDFVDIDIKMKNLGRIAAQTAKQVIIQGIREAERNMLEQEYSTKLHKTITVIVTKIDPLNGNAIVLMQNGKDKTEAFLPVGEQIKGEKLNVGDHIKVYVSDVRVGKKGPQVMISRTQPELVRGLFELEVPEISEGLVTVHSVSREAGSRSKISVSAANSDIGAVGACIGPKGTRIANIVNELKGEKIDIINYSDDAGKYISAALAPAEVISVSVSPDEKSCTAIVNDDQLSLAIGKEGQNVRLAARLTGYRIDIKPLSQVENSSEAVQE